jgi:hypothetical protein
VSDAKIRTYRGVNIHPKNVHGMYWALVNGGQVAADTVDGMKQLIRDALDPKRKE